MTLIAILLIGALVLFLVNRRWRMFGIRTGWFLAAAGVLLVIAVFLAVSKIPGGKNEDTAGAMMMQSNGCAGPSAKCLPKSTSTSTTDTTAAPASTSTTLGNGPDCANQHEFTGDVDPNSNLLGPILGGSTAKEKAADLRDRMRLDPSLTVVQAVRAKLPGFTDLDANGLRDKQEQLRDNCADWAATLNSYDAHMVLAGDPVLETNSGEYHTLNAIHVPGGLPILGKVDVSRERYEVLEWTFSDGHIEMVSTMCGGQPVERDFPSIPPLPVTPPGSPTGPQPTTPTPTTTTRPTTTTSSSTPPTSSSTTQPEQTTTTKFDYPADTDLNDRPVYQPPVDPGPTSPGTTEVPPPAVRTEGTPEAANHGASGNGGAGPATGPADTTHSQDTTPATASPPCPFGPGNC